MGGTKVHEPGGPSLTLDGGSQVGGPSQQVESCGINAYGKVLINYSSSSLKCIYITLPSSACL